MSDALSAALSEGRTRLPGVPEPMRDARLLLAHAAGLSRESLHRLNPEALSAAVLGRYAALIERRAGGEPVSRILGYRDFWRSRFRIGPGVLDPRPETETLVSCALAASFGRVLDLGTGSGCILLSLLAERSGATGLGSDLCPDALDIARANAADLGLGDRADFVLSDWCDAIAGTFDLVVANPPYIAEAEIGGLSAEVREHDPIAALSPGPDGLAAYRRILSGARSRLLPGGRLLVEVGWRQGGAVADLFRGAGLDAVTVHPDLDGRGRVVGGIAPE